MEADFFGSQRVSGCFKRGQRRRNGTPVGPQTQKQKYRVSAAFAKSLISLEEMAPRAGFEPATNRLTAGCSTAELPGIKCITSVLSV